MAVAAVIAVSLVEVITDVDVIHLYGFFFYLASAVMAISLADAMTDVDVTTAVANIPKPVLNNKTPHRFLWGVFHYIYLCFIYDVSMLLHLA